MSKGKKLDPRPAEMRDCGGPCFWIAEAAWDHLKSLLDPQAIVIYAALVLLQNRFRGTTRENWFWASYDQIKRESGLSVTTVKRRIKLLVSEGLIRKTSGKFKGKTGGNEANNYMLTHFEYRGRVQPSAKSDDLGSLKTKPLDQSEPTLSSEETNPLGASNSILETHQERTDSRASPEESPGSLCKKEKPAALDSVNGADANAAQDRSSSGNEEVVGAAEKPKFKKGDIVDGRMVITTCNGEPVWKDLEPSTEERADHD